MSQRNTTKKRKQSRQIRSSRLTTEVLEDRRMMASCTVFNPQPFVAIGTLSQCLQESSVDYITFSADLAGSTIPVGEVNSIIGHDLLIDGRGVILDAQDSQPHFEIVGRSSPGKFNTKTVRIENMTLVFAGVGLEHRFSCGTIGTMAVSG